MEIKKRIASTAELRASIVKDFGWSRKHVFACLHYTSQGRSPQSHKVRKVAMERGAREVVELTIDMARDKFELEHRGGGEMIFKYDGGRVALHYHAKVDTAAVYVDGELKLTEKGVTFEMLESLQAMCVELVHSL